MICDAIAHRLCSDARRPTTAYYCTSAVPVPVSDWTRGASNLLSLTVNSVLCFLFFLAWTNWAKFVYAHVNVFVCGCLIFNRSVDEKIPPGLIGSCWPHDQPTRKCWQLIPYRLIIWLIILESSDWCTYLCVCMCVCACLSFICKSLGAVFLSQLALKNGALIKTYLRLNLWK